MPMRYPEYKSAHVSAAMAERLAARAALDDVSESEVIRRALDHGLDALDGLDRVAAAIEARR